jgi:peptidoglycan hydrolase CwlO-like protein
VKNFVIGLILVSAIISFILLFRFNRENADVTKILEQERYSRMIAEEELQKSEYRIKKLEADLQTTQVKLSKSQEVLDKEKSQAARLKSQMQELDRAKSSLEKDLELARKEKALLDSRAAQSALVEDAGMNEGSQTNPVSSP